MKRDNIQRALNNLNEHIMAFSRGGLLQAMSAKRRRELATWCKRVMSKIIDAIIEQKPIKSEDLPPAPKQPTLKESK